MPKKKSKRHSKMKVIKDAKDIKYGRVSPPSRKTVLKQYGNYLMKGKFPPGTRPAVKKVVLSEVAYRQKGGHLSEIKSLKAKIKKRKKKRKKK